MSPVERTEWVVGLDVDCYAKAVLHVIAFRVNSATFKCWITIDRLAQEAGMSRRKVQATIRDLESAGLLKSNRSAGRKANTYHLNMKANHAHRAPLNRARRAPLRVVNRAQVVIQPCTTGISTVHAVHPEPGTEPSKEPGASSTPSVWDIGARILGSRNLLGRLIRDHGEEAVGQAITSTDLKRPADAKSYLLGVLKSKKQPEVPRAVSDW